MTILHDLNRWIFQRMSELAAGLLLPGSSGFMSRSDRVSVYRILPEIPSLDHNDSLQGCCRLNPAQQHPRDCQNDARGGKANRNAFVVQIVLQ